MYYSKRLHNYLSLNRKRQGYRQKDLAVVLGCSEGQLINCEGGRALPSLRLAIKLVLLYQSSLEKLFPGLCQEVREELDRNAVRIRNLENVITIPYQPKRKVVLGLHPWHGGMGVAVLEGNELVHWATHRVARCSSETWFRENARVLLESIVARFKPETVVLPGIEGTHRSLNVADFTKVLKDRTIDQSSVVEYRPDQLHKTLSKMGVLPKAETGTVKARPRRFRGDTGDALRRLETGPAAVQKHRSHFTKNALALAVTRRYPELETKLPPKRTITMKQDPRMAIFEAVALALCGTSMR